MALFYAPEIEKTWELPDEEAAHCLRVLRLSEGDELEATDGKGKIFKLKVCSKTLRSIEHNGGLDAYLESTSNSKLTEEAKKIKKSIAKKKAAK